RISGAVGVRGGVHVVGPRRRGDRRHARAPRRRDASVAGIRRPVPLLALAGIPASGNMKARPTHEPQRGVGDQTIRVLLSGTAATPRVSSPDGFVLVDRDNALAARAERNQAWKVEQSAGRVRAVRPDGVPTVW